MADGRTPESLTREDADEQGDRNGSGCGHPSARGRRRTVPLCLQRTGKCACGGRQARERGTRQGQDDDAVVLSEAKIAEAGIELAKAGPGTLRDSLVLNGILQPNQEALVQVTPRFPGVFRELAKRVGDRVEKNELLGKIESNQSLTTYELRAPIAGTIIDRQASLGEFASEQKPAFVIADLRTVWVDFAVYRRDLGRVRAAAPC